MIGAFLRFGLFRASCGVRQGASKSLVQQGVEAKRAENSRIPGHYGGRGMLESPPGPGMRLSSAAFPKFPALNPLNRFLRRILRNSTPSPTETSE